MCSGNRQLQGFRATNSNAVSNLMDWCSSSWSKQVLNKLPLDADSCCQIVCPIISQTSYLLTSNTSIDWWVKEPTSRLRRLSEKTFLVLTLAGSSVRFPLIQMNRLNKSIRECAARWTPSELDASHSSDTSADWVKRFFKAFTPPDSSRQSQSGQEGLDDRRNTEEDQEGRGLKERGGTF